MKIKILTLFAIVAATIGLASCHDDNWNPNTGDKNGTLSLSSMDVEVSNAENVISRASVDVSRFIVKIYDADGALVNQWTYGDMPEIVSLPVGEYSVKVYSHEIEKAEWEHPYFEGSKSFSIADSRITEIGTVKCVFASLKVSIRFSDALKAVMQDDVKVTVIANDEGRLEYTPGETRAGYFEVVDGSMTLVATFTGTVSGYYETFNKIYTDIEAGQHRIITFSLKTGDGEIPDETGKIDTAGGINVDVSVIDEDLSGNITVDEGVIDGDRPGKEDGTGEENPPTPPVGDDDDAITITSATLSFDSANQVADDIEGVVDIHSDNGVKNFIVTISSDNEQFIKSVSELMPTSFDLAYPGDDAEAIGSLGFPIGNDVIGKNDLKFDITTFIPLLKSFPGTHGFTLAITDQSDIKLSKTLTFIAQ